MAGVARRTADVARLNLHCGQKSAHRSARAQWGDVWPVWRCRAKRRGRKEGWRGCWRHAARA